MKQRSGAAAAAAGSAAALAALVFASTPAAAGAEFACSQDTVLTLVGVDTAAGTVLLAAAGDETAKSGWLVELRGDGGSATYYPAPNGPSVFGGSIGPGPLFAVQSCGTACLQAVRWSAGAWEPLAEPLRAPVAANVYPTYDAAGRPWLVLQGARSDAETHPGAEAWAFRLEGREWASAGHLAVTASGATGALPAPGSGGGSGAVVSGSGRFASGAAPETWLHGLPKVSPGDDGEVAALAGAVAYLDAAGAVYLSRDDGASWVVSRWTPWGVTRTQLWQLGRDYTVDLPAGDRGRALPLAWFDRRDRDRERLVLTEWTSAGDWRTLAELPTEVVTLDGQHLPFDLLITPRPQSWLLLAGCVYTRSGPGLALQTYSPAGGLSPPRFVELRAGGSAADP